MFHERLDVDRVTQGLRAKTGIVHHLVGGPISFGSLE